MSSTEKTSAAPLVFHYERPAIAPGKKKAIRWLGRTSISYAAIHVIGHGGENVLHSHLHHDGYWLVLSGRARFYTTGDEVVAELGPFDGVVTPRNFPYWFESIGEEELELLQFEASDEEIVPGQSDRVAHAPENPTFHDHVDKAEVYRELKLGQ